MGDLRFNGKISPQRLTSLQDLDIDRLDVSWIDSEKPEFSRGLRVVNNGNVETAQVKRRYVFGNYIAYGILNFEIMMTRFHICIK
jgi:hypothetical protein